MFSAENELGFAKYEPMQETMIKTQTAINILRTNLVVELALVCIAKRKRKSRERCSHGKIESAYKEGI